MSETTCHKLDMHATYAAATAQCILYASQMLTPAHAFSLLTKQAAMLDWLHSPGLYVVMQLLSLLAASSG